MEVVTAVWRRKPYGLILWFIAFAVVMIIFAKNPELRSVTPSYRFGSANFLDRQPIYDLNLLAGYLYAPAFAVLFAPFYLLGPYLGDGLWRLLCFGVLTYAAFRQARRIEGVDRLLLLSTGLALALPVSLGALRNGQSTILLTGACWLLILSAVERKAAQTLIWATIAIIAKPVAIIVLLLVGAIRFRLVPVLVLSVAIVLAIPYGFAPVDYVNGLYRSFTMLMFDMSLQKSTNFTPADFTAPLAVLGFVLSETTLTAIRLAFALATLSAVVLIDRSVAAKLAGLAIAVVAFYYMSVFSPRVEANTYAFLGAPFGIAIAFMLQRSPRALLPIVLAAGLFISGLTGLTPDLARVLHLWFRPVVCTLIVLGMVGWAAARWRHGGSAELRLAAVGPIVHG